MSNLVERIEKLCMISNISIRKLEANLGLGRGIINGWESGNASPNLSSLIPIAEYFNVSIDYLCGRTDNPCITQSNSISNEKLLQMISILLNQHTTEKQLDAIINFIQNANRFNA